MSLKFVTIFYWCCDGCGIEVEVPPETTLNFPSAHGWTRRGKKDLCKRCSKPKRVPKAKQK